MNRFMRSFFAKPDQALAILGCLFGLLFGVLIIIGKFMLVYLPIVLIVIISCMFYLYKNEGLYISNPGARVQQKTRFLQIVYFMLFSSSLSVLYFTNKIYVRPVLYYFFIVASCLIIVLQIVSNKSTNPLGIITQIIILGINVRWTQLFIYPSVIGIDPFWHQMFTSLILEEGSIPSGYAYSGLPSMHIHIAITSLLTECSYKVASAMTISLAQVLITTLVIYALGTKIIGNRFGLLGALLFVSADWSIHLGFAVIPNTLAGIFALILVYLVITSLLSIRSKDVFRSTFLSSIVLSFALIASHALTAAWLALVIVCIWILAVFYNTAYLKSDQIQNSKTNRGLISFIVLFGVFLFSWWMHASGHLSGLTDIVRWMLTIDVEDIKQTRPINVQEYLMTLPPHEQMMINLGFFLYCGVSLIGCFYLLSRNRDKVGFVLAGISMLTLLIGFLAQFSALIHVAQRFWYFAEILLAIPLALSLFFISERKGATNKLVIVSVSCILIGFMLISPSVSYDHSALTPHYSVRYGLFTSELTAMDTINSRYSDAHCLSDGYYAKANGHLYPGTNLWENVDWQLATKSPILDNGDLMLLRTEILSKPVMCLSTIYKLDYNPAEHLEISGYSKVYNVGTVFGYGQAI